MEPSMALVITAELISGTFIMEIISCKLSLHVGCAGNRDAFPYYHIDRQTSVILYLVGRCQCSSFLIVDARLLNNAFLATYIDADFLLLSPYAYSILQI